MSSKKHVFTALEKKYFIDILKRYSRVVESKDTDGASLRAKNDALESITREYYASPHTTMQVTNKQLRRLWMNLKQRQREAITKERQHRVATGRGQSVSDADIDPDVSQVAPALLVSVDEAIDSDSFTDLPSEPTPTNSQAPSTITTEPTAPIQCSQPMTTPVSFLTPTPCPPSSSLSPTPRPQSSSSTPTLSYQRHKNSIVEREYKDRHRRAEELHALEIELMHHRVREAKAKVDLAEFLLDQKQVIPVILSGMKIN